jgi:hypothetical protein
MTETIDVAHMSETEMIEVERLDHKQVFADGGDMWAVNTKWMHLWDEWIKAGRPNPSRSHVPGPTPRSAPELSLEEPQGAFEDDNLYLDL